MRTLWGTLLGSLLGITIGAVLWGVPGAVVGGLAMTQLSTILVEYSKERGWPPALLYLTYMGPLIGSLGLGLPFQQPVGRILGGMLGFIIGAMVSVGLITRIYQPPRLQEGRCRECGYDLTGNLSGICPECGREVDRR